MVTYNYTDFLNGPSLLYPNGGEFITSREITIKWLEPTDINSHNTLIWYEIFFIESYSNLKKPEWMKIAMIPTENTLFIWDIPDYIKGYRCRIGIQAVNNWGERSKMSYSAVNFSIQLPELPIPSVAEPLKNSNYYSFVPFIFDKKGIVGKSSQRSYYQIYYSSKNLNKDWTLIKGEIPVDSDPFYWDIRDIQSSDDYSFKIELIDEENISEPIFINNVTINSLNYFIIDTLPPVGSVKILNHKEYTKERDIIIETNPYDKTTAVKSFRIEQLNIHSTGNTVSVGPYNDINKLSTWHIQENDGPKLIQVRYKDYGNNILIDSSDEDFFRSYQSLNNEEVTAFLTVKTIDSYDAWTAFGGSSPQLYLNHNLISTLEGEATSLTFYNNTLYIAIKDNNNKGILQRYAAETIKNVYEINENDSIINTMVIFDDKIFMGLENGKLIAFNGSTVTTVNENNIFNNSINYIYSNNNNLFIFLEKYVNIWVLRKNSSSQYFFSEIIM